MGTGRFVAILAGITVVCFGLLDKEFISVSQWFYVEDKGVVKTVNNHTTTTTDNTMENSLAAEAEGSSSSSSIQTEEKIMQEEDEEAEVEGEEEVEEEKEEGEEIEDEEIQTATETEQPPSTQQQMDETSKIIEEEDNNNEVEVEVERLGITETSNPEQADNHADKNNDNNNNNNNNNNIVIPPTSSSGSLTTYEPNPNCTSEARRRLAKRDAEATEEQWQEMTACLMQEEVFNKFGHFFLHVSKSGGTSADALLKKAHCTNKFMRPKHLGFQTNWYKKKRLRENHARAPGWYFLMEDLVQSTSCARMQEGMKRHGQILMISEGIIPFDETTTIKPVQQSFDDNNIVGMGGCPNMVNSMIFREPATRVESHYRHITNHARVKQDTQGLYDVQWMSKVYDVMSDNYYTRSLVAHGFMEWEETNKTLVDHPEAWTKIFPIANASLHSMDWMMLMSSGQEEEEENRNLIVRYGLGLGPDRTFPHQRPGKHKESALSDPEYMRQLNALDYKLWEEAIEMNRLDVISIKRMKPYMSEALAQAKAVLGPRKKSHKRKCCGHVCRSTALDVVADG